MKLLRQFILEFAASDMNQSVVKTDDDNDIVIRKMVKFRKNATRFHKNQNVDAEVDPETMNLWVDDVELWRPDIDGKT